MSILTATTPVTEAVVEILQDATLQTAIDGRLFVDIPQDTLRPCVLVEILGEVDTRGFGTGNIPELDLRVHTFVDSRPSEARSINGMIVALLKDAALTITGFTQCGRVVWHETVTLPNQELRGDKVHETVSLFTVIAEQSA